MADNQVVKWEYQEVYLNWGVQGFNPDESPNMAQPLHEQLNVYGEEGWELVEIGRIRNSLNGMAIFKRIAPPKERVR